MYNKDTIKEEETPAAEIERKTDRQARDSRRGEPSEEKIKALRSRPKQDGEQPQKLRLWQVYHRERKITMAINELEKKIEALKEWEALQAEAEAQVEALKDELKAEMLKRETEELEAGRFILRWTTTISNRFDSAAFKKLNPDVYKAFTKQTTSRRFTVA